MFTFLAALLALVAVILIGIGGFSAMRSPSDGLSTGFFVLLATYVGVPCALGSLILSFFCELKSVKVAIWMSCGLVLVWFGALYMGA